MIPRLALTLAALIGVAGAEARAQRKDPAGTVPPQPMPLAVKIRREGKTEIPLRIYGRANEPLKYLIRTPPAHGRLLEQRQPDRESVVVVYEPPAELTITADKFSFAVQSSAGVSAPVEVSLTIVDQPPHLLIPNALEFAAVRAGATSAQLLEISNRGGGIAAGEVIVDRPWKIDGKNGYRLRASDVAVFKIIFAPATGGAFDGVARFTSDPEHSTSLRGEAESSVVASPARVVLERRSGDPVRTGSFELENRTDEPRVLQLKADARLQLPPEVTLPARGKITVPIQTAAGDAQPLEADIHIEAPGFELTVPVRGPKLGPFLQTSPAAILFGQLKVGQLASARFELENSGGAPGDVTWEISAPFRVAQNSAILLPGEKRSFPLEIETKAAGKYRTWLQIKTSTQTLDLPVEAEVTEPPRKSDKTTSAPGAPPAGPAETPASEPWRARTLDREPVIPTDWLTDFEWPAGVKVTAWPTRVTIEWPASLSTATHFRVELRDLVTDAEGNVRAVWLAPQPVPIEARGNSFVATLDGLEPGQQWTARILPLDDKGVAGPRLFAADFPTLPKPNLLQRIPALPILLVLFGILLAWRAWDFWRRRR